MLADNDGLVIPRQIGLPVFSSVTLKKKQEKC